MQNQRTISYQQAADELRDFIIALYNKKIFPRMGKIFADQLFLTGTEAGGYLSVLADLEEIHVKRDTAQCALIRLKRVDYILNTMVQAAFFTNEEAQELSIFLKKIIPALKNLLVEIYNKIERDNNAMIAKACSDVSSDSVNRAVAVKNVTSQANRTVEQNNAIDEGGLDSIGSILSGISGESDDNDPDGFGNLV